MSQRKWEPGSPLRVPTDGVQTLTWGGRDFRYEIVWGGKRRPDSMDSNDRDLVLLIEVGMEMVPVPFPLVLLMVEFLYWNEQTIYNPAINPKVIGGKKFTDRCGVAIDAGWEHAAGILAAEKIEARRRRDGL